MSQVKSQLRWALLVLASSSADGHEVARTGVPQSAKELWRSWPLDPGVVILLAVSLALYATGTRRLWRATRPGSGLRTREVVCFTAGWVALVLALMSPLHSLGNALFAAHMVQHEVLMLVAAPLLVLGRPLVAFLWALPRRWTKSLARAAGAP